MSDTPLTVPCPQCAARLLHLRWLLEATDGIVGGSTPKVAAREWPYLVCDGCGWRERGKFERT